MSSVPPPSSEHPAPLPARPELPEGVWRPEPPPRPRAADALPRWPLWAPFAAMLGTLIVAVVGVGVIALVVELAGVDTVDDTPPGVTIGGTYVQDLALIGSALAARARCSTRPRRRASSACALPAPGPRSAGRCSCWVAFFAFAAIWSRLLDITENDDLPEELGVDGSTLALVAVALLVCVLAPIAEELFFRGFCFTALRRALGHAACRGR